MKVLLLLVSLLFATQGVAEQAKIKVRSLTLRGNTVLTTAEKRRLSKEVIGQTYPNYEEISQRVLRAYQDRGYFKTIVDDAVPITSSGARTGDGVDVLVRVKESVQYRLGAIVIKGVTAFPPTIIRNQLPIKPGDVFSRSLIARGLEDLRRLYDSAGYINCTTVPDTQIQEDRGLITLVIDVEQGKRFHWGKLVVNGDQSLPGAKEKLISAWSKYEGTVFDWDGTIINSPLQPRNPPMRNRSIEFKLPKKCPGFVPVLSRFFPTFPCHNGSRDRLQGSAITAI